MKRVVFYLREQNNTVIFIVGIEILQKKWYNIIRKIDRQESKEKK